MHDLTSPLSIGVATALGVAAVTALWLSPCNADPLAQRRAATSMPDPQTAAPAGEAIDVPPTNLAELRARGPAALDELLARYRRASRRSWVDPRWEAAIDAVAGQRYASASGLYWYTDLALAEQEAQRRHRPILALRMLGDLREDLSCANSRMFRATLYANTEVAAFLREHFVMYWSSERTVPIVTIDFGDGKKLVRTTTGNSAHYVLDEAGHVLDVLPGLYAPVVFRSELTRSLALAERVRGKRDAERIRATVAYHTAALEATERAWQRAQGAQYIRGSRFLVSSSTLAQAQRATMAKMAVEVPDLRAIGLMQPGEVPDEAAAWSAIGQKIWGIDERTARPQAGHRAPRAEGDDDGERYRSGQAPAPMVLDDASRALVRQLHNTGALPRPATAEELDAVLARLEQHIVADTALNQFRLRPAIHRHIVDGSDTDFTALNKWIYGDVFATPSSDPWLGLLPRTDFTGLPGDGVVMP